MEPLHLNYEYEMMECEVIEVSLNMPANVQLMGAADYDSYRGGRMFHYLGGYVETFPFLIAPPRPGHWHLVIDLGGGAGKLRGCVRVLFESTAVTR